MSAVVINGLERRFGSTRVLSRVDLVVDPGEHIAITGANGSGKTTLLRVITGLLRPTSGRVEVLGGSTGDPDVRARIGLIGHAPGLYARMSAAENIRFWSRLYGAPHALDRGGELLAELGLDPGDRRPVAEYSQGMRQRAAVARALCTSPELVIADEPLAGLDADGVRAVTDVLARCPTVVVATHDLDGVASGRRFELVDGDLAAR
ncbi:MAG TPA: ABC transporter ATP-binding protein [Actinomycetota bacterium]|jgi:ABC-2 type transport system ATP-binding protein|nr:ABC transporter ATP-binding protein [Actinomycetota bacterium]